ncbi:MAG: PDDEXK nuclease domain-containing protein [Bacteroidales bacterium]|nr:PDDEXK nuclease domain-containing protein [Bacteroidales bacterium]MDD4150481.1 PDDEXK nuclease domain-containing protein [Bacteroidales bacterium]MDY0217690.1 PDDEXK nuclease domain-containing protein [Bacteroidales bacterium]
MNNNDLLKDIRSIILDARKYVSSKVNYAQIISNWMVGMRIVVDEQGGDYTAEYGKKQIQYLSENLANEFGTGYSSTNLWYFRQFYLQYPIPHAVSGELNDRIPKIIHAASGESNSTFYIEKYISSIGDQKHPLNEIIKMNLNWTHHRILLKIDNPEIRKFYLNEANENNWGTRALQRQVNSLYYERLLSSQNKNLVKAEAQEKTKSLVPEDILKDPMVLEFLQLKNNKTYLESEFEQALLDHLSEFLLELGKGFAFVARQKRIRTETKEYAVDLVFYNYLLKCFVLIDLKTRELQHGDIGQIDMYVRYFEDKIKSADDNPTIGIIMATEKDETVIKYSVLNESKQLFATKYKLFMPSIEELKNEIEKSKLNYKLKN